MNLAESPSPSPSSSSGSDDFAALLDSELELASAADLVTLGGASASPTGNDDEEDLEEEDEVVVEVEALEQNGLQDISSSENELGIRTIASKDDPNKSIFTLDSMHMLTKLRPFVNKFLKEASSMFDMYIYTMGDKAYAIEIAKLVDPDNIYFSSKVISNSDCTQRHQKGLDVVLGAESVAVILDDSENVWQKHKENLIVMERYHYFASSCRQFGVGARSLSESMHDERESDGALATILGVLKRIHAIFFDSDVETDLSSRDVREVIKTVRNEVLQGCKLVFSRVFPRHARPQDQFIWKMAEQLGAVCCTDVDSKATHVVAVDPGTDKAHWAARNKKFLVHPRWVEAANFRWHQQPEENFPVPLKEKGKDKERSKDKENVVGVEKVTGQDKDNAIAGREKAQENAVPSHLITTAGPTDS
ncbi:hypothetical protein QOZ80_5AG0374580 [Eleusine coracana subsp. coracana]|nr:hypothetical protein QOZ80_5AG0374580 [Eleusine coracana subsp. coracana]